MPAPFGWLTKLWPFAIQCYHSEREGQFDYLAISTFCSIESEVCVVAFLRWILFPWQPGGGGGGGDDVGDFGIHVRLIGVPSAAC